MRRGDLYWASLDPVRGNEAGKTRPVVIVSNDRATSVAARLGRGVVTVVPVTSNVDRIYPFQVLLDTDGTGLRTPSKAQAEQVRSVSVDRLGALMGRVPAATMVRLDEALSLHLGL